MKKRFIIVIAIILAAVALIVVFVNLFKDRTTTSLSNSVVEYTTTGYLNEESEEYLKVKEYLSNLKTKVQEEISSASEANVEKYVKYLQEVQNLDKIYDNYVKLGVFYNQNIYFTSYNKTYTRNQNAAKKALSNARKTANNMKQYIENNKYSILGEWLIKSWGDIRTMAINFIGANNEAFLRLKNIYLDCGDGILSNEFSDLVLVCVTDEFKKQAEEFSTSSVSNSQAKIYIDSYLKPNFSGTLNYYLTPSLQTSVKSIYVDGKLAERSSTNSAIYDLFVSGALGA